MEECREIKPAFEMQLLITAIVYTTLCLCHALWGACASFRTVTVVLVHTTNITLSCCSSLFFQVPSRGLPHRRVHKRLPGCLLSSLWRLGAGGAHRALRPLHGQLRWLQHVRPHLQGLQALGVQQAALSQWSAQVFREVPALHSLLPGLRIQARQRILLHLWVRFCTRHTCIHWTHVLFLRESLMCDKCYHRFWGACARPKIWLSSVLVFQLSLPKPERKKMQKNKAERLRMHLKLSFSNLLSLLTVYCYLTSSSKVW